MSWKKKIFHCFLISSHKSPNTTNPTTFIIACERNVPANIRSLLISMGQGFSSCQHRGGDDYRIHVSKTKERKISKINQYRHNNILVPTYRATPSHIQISINFYLPTATTTFHALRLMCALKNLCDDQIIY